MPVGRVEILDGFEFEAGGVDFLFDGGQFLEGPQLVRVAGQAPAAVVADGLVAGLVAARGAEIIHQMDDQMRAAALFGEAVMLRVELVAVKAESEFHAHNHRRKRGYKFNTETSPPRLGLPLW